MLCFSFLPHTHYETLNVYHDFYRLVKHKCLYFPIGSKYDKLDICNLSWSIMSDNNYVFIMTLLTHRIKKINLKFYEHAKIINLAH